MNCEPLPPTVRIAMHMLYGVHDRDGLIYKISDSVLESPEDAHTWARAARYAREMAEVCEMAAQRLSSDNNK